MFDSHGQVVVAYLTSHSLQSFEGDSVPMKIYTARCQDGFSPSQLVILAKSFLTDSASGAGSAPPPRDRANLDR